MKKKKWIWEQYIIASVGNPTHEGEKNAVRKMAGEVCRPL